jgi:hypothetical protein
MRGISCVCGQVKKPIVEGDEEELERRRSNDRCHEERDRDRSIRHREDLPPPPYTDVTQAASESVPKSSSSYAGSFHSRNDPGSSSVMDSLSSIYAAGAI